MRSELGYFAGSLISGLNNGAATLKPQDSFGEFDKCFLDLQKMPEIIRKHHQTFLQLF